MLDLPGVTLVCVDCVNHSLALRALAKSMQGTRYARALFLTADLPAGVGVPAGVEVVAIAPLRSQEDYSRFMLRDLVAHVATPHVLVIQWDGYVIEPAGWDPRNLDCDYLGARWPWVDDGMAVGNGGFSLRSRRLLEALRDPRIGADAAEPEDSAICRTGRPLLEREYGIRFGTPELADRFSYEATRPVGRPFGFHGLFNFWLTVPDDELAALAPAFSDAMARSPQLLQLARNLVALGRFPVAAALARRILATDAAHAEAQSLLARAEGAAAPAAAVGRNDPCPCGSGRKYKQCHGALGAPARAQPPAAPDVDALVQRALADHERGDVERAEAAYRRALAQAPAHPLAAHYLGVALYQRHALAEALPLLEASCASAPGEPEFPNNLGLALAAADRDDEAIAAYRRTLALAPDHAVAWNNLGLALVATNRTAEAIAAYREAIARRPDFAQAHWNLSLALLQAGQYAEGWREYDWRLDARAFAPAPAAAGAPAWDGTVRPGMTLLLTPEQGLGDALQFARFVAPLARRGVRAVVRAPAPLVELMRTVPGVAAVIGPDDAAPAHDATLPLLSLPRVLGVGAADLPGPVPYLTADPARRALARHALARTPGRRIGLAWAGNPEHRNDRRRSLPLAALAPLFALPDTAWYSLQKGAAARAVASVPAARALIPLAPDNTFDDTAALVAELDLVVSVDTSIVHLAGALGRRTFVLLPFAPDWRWSLDAADSAWYPTARLVRQPRAGDWDAVVRAVVAALAES